MIRPALILMVCAIPLFAQTERTAALGDRVRISAPKAGYRRLTGNIIGTTPDVLQLRLEGGPTEVAVQRTQITELLLSINTRRNTIRGVFFGTLTGAAIAYLYGPKPQRAAYETGTGRTPTINIISGAVGGAAIGGLIGHYTRSDLWVVMSPQP